MVPPYRGFFCKKIPRALVGARGESMNHALSLGLQQVRPLVGGSDHVTHIIEQAGQLEERFRDGREEREHVLGPDFVLLHGGVEYPHPGIDRRFILCAEVLVERLQHFVRDVRFHVRTKEDRPGGQHVLAVEGVLFLRGVDDVL